jgi:ATP-binding cassette subfamily B protein
LAEADTPERFTLQEYFTPDSKRRLRRFPSLLKLAISIVWKAAPRELVVTGVLQLVIAVGIMAQLLVLRGLLTGILQPSPDFEDLLPDVLALTAVAVVLAVASAFMDAQQRIMNQIVGFYASDRVVETAVGVDLVTYEAPGFHDRLVRAQLSASTRPAQLVTGLLGAIGASLTIGAILLTLVFIFPPFAVMVLVAFIPLWLATNRASGLVYRYTVDQTERDRMRLYLFDLLTNKPQAQEVRAFDLAAFLGERHRRIYRSLIDELRLVLRARLKVALAGQLATAVLTSVGFAMLIWFVTSDRISLSDAGSAAAAMVLLIGRLRGLAGAGSGLYESSLYLEDYSTFVAAAPQIQASRPTARAPREPQLLEAHDVSFTYPSRTEPSLQDASLELRRGEVVALVGENGSGKTTFAKMLAGLYAPEAGTITWDGTDIATFDPMTVRERVAVIFQDFARYQLSGRENIAMGDHAHFEDIEKVERAARAAGVHEALSNLENGYETLLGPEYYGGSDFSGGQWQRVALARAFFRDAPIVILDEPTASLDPRAEADLYDSMRELFAGRGVLLISHRFGSVKNADRIYVLRDGRVIESGPHIELLEADGYYAELFRLQARQYVDLR